MPGRADRSDCLRQRKGDQAQFHSPRPCRFARPHNSHITLTFITIMYLHVVRKRGQFLSGTTYSLGRAPSYAGMNIRSPSTKFNPSDASPLRIAGFGACMIAGYPHKDGGLFEVACGLIEQRLARPVNSTIVSLGGFPAARAEKYLKKKVFDFDPRYIVIQFGATDAQCPIRAGRHLTASCSKSSTSGNSKSATPRTISFDSQPATLLSSLRWQIASLIGHLRKIEPITPVSAYAAAIERMVGECRSAGIKPVVLSPFVYGSQYATGKSMAFVAALRELRSRTQDMILVDCVSLLANFPRSGILQHDGFHLSRAGHNLVGEAIAQSIVDDIITADALSMRANDYETDAWPERPALLRGAC